MTTIKDLADIVGVSHSTVARALNDHPAITPAVKARVRAAAEAHGYIANAAARALRGQSGTLVGFVVPDIEENDMAAMAKAIAECVNATGRQLVVSCSGDAPERELAHVRALVGARAAALVLVPSERPLPETIALLGRLPTVQLVRRVEALAAEAFVFDDEAAIHEATAHLILRVRSRSSVGGALVSPPPVPPPAQPARTRALAPASATTPARADLRERVKTLMLLLAVDERREGSGADPVSLT